jgi:cytochrome c-type biogenesis protein CcmH/NrfG
MSRRVEYASPTSTSRPISWAPLLVAGVTFLVFAPLCTAEFTWWDDWATIHQNPWLNPPTPATLKHYWSSIAYGLYAPLTYTVWAGLAWVARLREPGEQNIQLNPWVFHSANVLVHVISAVIVYLLLRRLVKKDWAAAFGALLFALHPVQVETVGWASGMKDLLAGCFGMIAVWRYVVRAQDRAEGSVLPDWIGTVALVLAMLAKPSAIVVPFIATAIDRLAIGRASSTVVKSTIVWVVMIVPIAVVARIAQDVTGIPKAPLWARPLVAGDTYAFYLYKIVCPIWLGVDYGRRPNDVLRHATVYFAWVVPAIVAIAAAVLSRNRRWVGASVLVFAIAIVPVSGVATFQYQFTSTVADHYLYVAMLGPAMALAYLLTSERKFAMAMSAIVLLLLAARSFVQAQTWHDDFTVFSNALEVNPNSFVAYNNLGNEYKRRGDSDKAMECFQHAMRLAPDYPNAFNNAAFIYAERGDWQAAVEVWERSVEIRSRLPRTLFPDYMEDHNRIGQILLAHGQYDRAIAHFEALLKLKPEHEEARKFLKIAKENATTQPVGSGNRR